MYEWHISFPDNVCLGNYVGSTNLYSVEENHNTNRNILNEHFHFSLQKWLYDNYMVLNPGKYCYLSFGSNPDKNSLILDLIVLGVLIDNKLTLYNHLKNLWKKIAQKLNALTRIATHLNLIRLIHNSFFKGQLSYCPLIWTFCSSRSNHLINKFQERALRRAYNDFNSCFSELREMENESITYIKRFSNKWLPLLFKKNPIILASKHRSTIKYCINTIAFKGPTQIVKINK